MIGNAPRYAIIPEQRTQSPKTVYFYMFHSTIFLPHEIFSPPRPFISFSARSNWTIHLYTFFLSYYSFFFAVWYWSSSFLNKDKTYSKAAFFSAKIFSALDNFYSASASCFFFGSTTSKAPYVSTTALIQSDKLPAAFEAVNTFYFSN